MHGTLRHADLCIYITTITTPQCHDSSRAIVVIVVIAVIVVIVVIIVIVGSDCGSERPTDR